MAKKLKLEEKKYEELILNINGKDNILKIDTNNIEQFNCLVEMCADKEKMTKEIKEAVETKNFEALREATNHAVDTSDRFYEMFCKCFPEFQIATNGVVIRDFSIWDKILTAIAEIISEAKEKLEEKNVEEAIASEVHDTLDEE